MNNNQTGFQAGWVGVLLLSSLAMGGCCGSCSEEPEHCAGSGAKSAGPNVDALLANLETPGGCSGLKDFCIAKNGWGKGTAAALPDEPTLFVGHTVTTDPDEKQIYLARDVFLVTRKEGSDHKARIFMPTPDKDYPSKSLSPVFEDRAYYASVRPDLLALGMSEARKAAYPLTKTSTGWALAGKCSAEIRRVDKYWVAIEKDADEGVIHVSILTDRVALGPDERH